MYANIIVDISHEQLDKTLNKPEPEKSDKISHSGDI